MATEDLKKSIAAHLTDQGKREINVPEWDERFFVSPMTLGEKSKLHAWRATHQSDPLAIFALTVVMKAEDAEGKRVFADGDIEFLKNKADPEVVSRLAEELTIAPPEVEAAKKD